MEPFYAALLQSFFSAIFILVVAIFSIWFFFRIKRKEEQKVPAIPAADQISLRLQLQAYERIILFLERISPATLVMRLHQPEMTAVQLQTTLIRTIREEFEYNMSQQLYISTQNWELVRHAKEESISLIHQAAGKIPDSASAPELIRQILDSSVNQETSPVHQAIREIKQEVHRLLHS